MAYDFKKMSVLIVEDNKPVMNLIKSLLKTFGVKTFYEAKNGEDGFVQYCLHNPDLVIADWMMKPIDGIEMTHLIRTHSESPDPFTPVILVTGFSEKKRVEKARDTGITEFMVKPFTARDLYARIVQIVEKPRRFVRSEDFFGPDRRRRKGVTFDGPYKRQTDVRPEDFYIETPPEDDLS